MLLLLLSVCPLFVASFGFGTLPCHTAARGVAMQCKPGGAMRMSSGGTDANGPFFQRVLLAATATPFVAHGEELPLPTRRLVSDRARIIFAFCAEYLANAGWDADLYASGGYVRDLLLGRISADLDLSFGLARCPPGVTVAIIAGGMDEFCRARPDLAVESVEVVSRLSDGAERKAVDAVQVCLLVDGEAVYVDLLPTIGMETYDSDDRIPRRDPRGSAEEDSLRRDLTIGSMLLEVTRRGETTSGDDIPPAAVLERVRRQVKALHSGSVVQGHVGNTTDGNFGNESNGGGASISAAVQAASDLRFVLLDYHGGIEDCFTRTLRCPVPREASLRAVWDDVIRTPDDAELARSLGLDPANATTAAAYPSYSDGTKIRALWWAKMMRDDPYRLLRALRFSATLGFRIDSSFWLAAPFALQPGIFDAKVSHTRKVDELRKIARGGVGGAFKLLKLFQTVLHPPVGGAAFRDAFFTVALADVGVMDSDKAERLVSQLPPELSVDEKVGAVLAVALLSCEKNDGNNNEDASVGNDDMGDKNSGANDSTAIGTQVGANIGLGVGQASYKILPGRSRTTVDVTLTPTAHVDASIDVAASLRQTQHRVERVCDGLRAPDSIRRAAVEPLSIARRLLEPLPVLGMHLLFARAVTWPLPPVPVSMEDRARQFATMIRLWNLLHLDPRSARRRPSSDPRWVLSLLAAAGGSTPSSREASRAARQLEADLRLLLSREGQGRAIGPQPLGGALLGRSVAGLPEVPPHLRSQVMGAVHVLSRLCGDAPTIETSDQLRAYLQSSCDGLLAKLTDEWWASGEENLRLPYVKK